MGDKVTSECAALLEWLMRLIYTDVTRPRKQAFQTNLLAGGAGFVSGLLLTVATRGLAAPVAIPAALGSRGWSFGSVVGGTWIGSRGR
jgi:hypothetical protein